MAVIPFGTKQQRAAGHLSTVVGHLKGVLSPEALPPSRSWHTDVMDKTLGNVRLNGRYTHIAGSTSALIIVHGLGGCNQSPYTFPAANAAVDAGMSALRLNLRGADCSGEDFYHAGLTSDLAQVIESEVLARYDHIFIFGYSLGGHLALRYACEEPIPRVRGIAAICSPLCLASSAKAFDRHETRVYRHYVLRNLKTMYRRVAEKRPNAVRHIGLSDQRLAAIRHIQDWDSEVVAKRHHFRDGADYYSQASASSILGRLTLPALLVHSENDPMVPLSAVRRSLAGLPPSGRSIVIPGGGHLGFPRDLRLAQDAKAGLSHQAVAWLLGQSGCKPTPGVTRSERPQPS